MVPKEGILQPCDLMNGTNFLESQRMNLLHCKRPGPTQRPAVHLQGDQNAISQVQVSFFGQNVADIFSNFQMGANAPTGRPFLVATVLALAVIVEVSQTWCGACLSFGWLLLFPSGHREQKGT